ncbi:MAG: hypothetical protein JSU86_15910 [Phycisphaerales bacterium]|nr:MAG: hypothetical protein JSU86_15910 [Phycisphaerales bacterium]
MQNCLVTCNDADDGGGLSLTTRLRAEVVNTTIGYNQAGRGGGIYAHSSCVEVHNSILWEDETSSEIYVDTNGDLTISYSVLQGGCEGIGHDTYYSIKCEPNVLMGNPKFLWPIGCDDEACTGDEDFRIIAGSPAIDSGNNILVHKDELDLNGDDDTEERTPLDLLLEPRFVDDPFTTDTGVNDPPEYPYVVDMGAYEYPGCPPISGAGFVYPPNKVIDARQPHPPADCSIDARQGIGSQDEPIYIGPPVSVSTSLSCWGLCETGIEPIEEGCELLDPNEIVSISEVDNTGLYELILERPISAGYVTELAYLGAGPLTMHASLPADANADCTSAPADITALINYLNEVEDPPHGDYSCDIDHSGLCGPPDINRLIDLLNGAWWYIVWNNRELDEGLEPDICQARGEGMLADGNGAFINGFVTHMSTVVITDAQSEADFKMIVDATAGFCVDNLSLDERATLADRLQDPSLKFESPLAEEMVPEIVSALLD